MYEKKNNKNEIKVKIEGENWSNALDKVFKKKTKDVTIPGFRKGKAPKDIFLKKYGIESLFLDACDEVIGDAYTKALENSKLVPVARPKVDIKNVDSTGVEFSFTIVTKPEVNIKKYKGLKVTKEKVSVTKEEIEHEISHILERYTDLVTKEGSVENGDVAIIDFEGFKDGVAFDGGKGENYELEIGSNTFIPGFEDQIVGMKAGEEKDVKVKFPDEYFSKDLAGKDATFKVKVNEIKKKELPELDDEFAKDVSEFDTLKELKASIKEKLEKENEEKVKYETQDAAVKAVCDNTEIDIPSGMIDSEIDNMVNDMKSRLQYQGLTLENYLKMVGKTEQEFRKDYEEQAKEAVKSRLVIEAIVKAEKIEADEKDVNAKIEEMAKNYGREAKDLEENEALKNYIKGSLETEKAIEFVVKNAKIK